MQKGCILICEEPQNKITLQHLQKIAKELGENITIEELQEMVEEANRNENGGIIDEDFLKNMKETNVLNNLNSIIKDYY